jgi:hypothetical protein
VFIELLKRHTRGKLGQQVRGKQGAKTRERRKGRQQREVGYK